MKSEVTKKSNQFVNNLVPKEKLEKKIAIGSVKKKLNKSFSFIVSFFVLTPNK